MATLAPQKDAESKSWFQPTQLERCGSFLFQGVFKQILTEGERYIVTFFHILTLSQQGIWER